MFTQLSLYLFVLLVLSYQVVSSPYENEVSTSNILKSQEILVAAIFLYLTIFVIALCACCRRHGSKIINLEKGYPISNQNQSQMSEFTIFPPVSGLFTQTNHILHDDEVTFEPLPEIQHKKVEVSLQNRPLRPAHFSNMINRGLSLQDWFEEPHCNFPRNKLQYLQEVGTGWFGQVVKGEAQNIITDEKKSQVVVKILREDATPSEHIYFLHEVCLFRDLHHPNILRLLGQCLESDPFLVILEYCTMDLKSYLLQQCSDPKSFLKGDFILHTCCNIASALAFMHERGFIHTDLAARNCLVTDNPIKVKIGDYGTSIQAFKNDYYCLGDMALPVRWSAPESLHCTETTIETKEVSQEANVWSFGVLMWEILEFGKLPYTELTDEEVLQKVIVEKSVCLQQPKTPCTHKDRMYDVMVLCWHPQSERLSMDKVLALLNHLLNNRNVPSDSSEFEKRWNALQPQSRELNLEMKTSDVPSVPLHFENNFVANGSEITTNKCKFIFSSREDSPSVGSVAAGLEIFTTNISPSLQNLTGSIEDLNKELLRNKNSHDISKINGDKNNQESAGVTAQQISEAIQDLDNVLAAEALSSSETSKHTTPEKTLKSASLSPKLEDYTILKSDCEMESKLNLDKEFSNEALWNSLESSEQSEKVKDFFKLTIIDSEGSSDSDPQSLTDNYNRNESYIETSEKDCGLFKTDCDQEEHNQEKSFNHQNK